MKTELQIRAEDAAERFRGARKPVIFEFAGVPQAGKTSTLIALQTFLNRCGFRVEIVTGQACSHPIQNKTNPNPSVWRVCKTLSQILERTQNPLQSDDPDILILDQGLFDTLCWLRLMERLARLRSEECKVIENFLRLPDWRRQIAAVFVMTASPANVLQREKGLLPAECKEGPIMNEKVLARLLTTTHETAKRLKNEFRIFEIDTSAERKGGARQIAEAVANLALNVIEEHLRNDVLTLPAEDVIRTFAGKRCLNASEAAALFRRFVKSGDYQPREEMEAGNNRVRAIAAIVVRDKSNKVLRLRRKEGTDGNPANEEIVIWTGGHVRKEDAVNGDPVLQCASREIREKLCLCPAAHELKLRGAVRAGLASTGMQEDVAVVYEWTAKTDDVIAVLSRAQIFERQGAARSGTFVPLKELARDVDDGKFGEKWSVEIVRELLARDYKFSPRLF